MSDVKRNNFQVDDYEIWIFYRRVADSFLIFKSDRYRFQLFSEAEGLFFKPDEFPNDYNIEYQLGQFIGFIHNKKYDYFGNQKIYFHTGFKENMPVKPVFHDFPASNLA